MKLLIVITALFVVAYAQSVEEEWQQFKLNHGKSYKSLLEEKTRFAVFQANVRKIEEHNEKFAKGESTFEMGITKFADLTEEEFRSTMTLKKMEKPTNIKVQSYIPKNIKINKTINYVLDGLVTEVKDQKTCGACWAFGVVGAIEGQIAKETKVLKSLSAQNLVDCDKTNDGCSFGYPLKAYQWILRNGIWSEEEYPYVGKANGRCLITLGGRNISAVVEIQPYSEEVLLEALDRAGPISTAMNADDLQFYLRGILTETGRCMNRASNHIVLLVGAATEDGIDYFLAKNSWGKDWGMDGYFKVKRQGNVCGILESNHYPIL